MREITAYQCSDGKIELNEKAAIDHENDLLGQEIDDFTKLLESQTLTRHDVYRATTRLIGKDRDKLYNVCKNIVKIIEHNYAQESES